MEEAEVIVTEIYAAREKFDPTIHSIDLVFQLNLLTRQENGMTPGGKLAVSGDHATKHPHA